MDGDSDCDEAPIFADFGLCEEENAVVFCQRHPTWKRPWRLCVRNKTLTVFQISLLLKKASLFNEEHTNPCFYVHRSTFFTCSPPAFSHEVCSATSAAAESGRPLQSAHSCSLRTQRHLFTSKARSHAHWEPSDEDLTLMCNAFSHMTTAQRFCLDDKDVERPRWKNKWIQKCIWELCSGPKHKHGGRLFSPRCCNDSPTGYDSYPSKENPVAVTDFLQLFNLHLRRLEVKEQGRCEE